MAKRLWDESGAAADPAEAKVKKLKVKEEKKKRKDKTVENGKPVPSEEAVHSDSKVARQSSTTPAADKDSLSKAERKALRRAKKEQLKAVSAAENAKQDGNNVSDEQAAAKAERKARRRAGKAAETANGGTMPEENERTILESAAGRATAVGGVRGESYYKEKQIAVEDPLSQGVAPILAFDALPFDEKTRREYFTGFAAPTPIQAASWPYLMQGRDLIGVAETGSGKTFAFGVPCISRLTQDSKRIQVCIVSPTRELALQIHEQMTKLAKPRGLGVTCVYGGVSKDEQRQQLKRCCILVATPGRLNDFIGDGTIDLSHVKYLVLDEADRMLDKGFELDVRKIITAAAPGKDRQTVMFTATWPPSVRDLAAEFLRQPARITIGDHASGELRANTRIVQEVEVIEEHEKQGRLIEILKQYQSGKNKKDRILVFCLYKKEATRIEEFIRRRGFPVAGIHGDLSQHKRTESLEAFKRGDVPLLVATDVAARGLDIPAVKLVLNVTFPLTVEDYVHRIGRTGRAGQDGRAITLFTQNEKGLAGALINVLKAADQPVPEALLKFGTTVKKKAHDAYGAFFRDPADMKQATKITFD